MSKSTWEFVASRDPEVAFWTFVIYCLVVVTVSIFFLFYFNRLVAKILSKVICYFTWSKYKAWIEIESIVFAPLTGKIMFKNLKYSSRNQSFSIMTGHLSFRYWIFKVRKETEKSDTGEADLPCRIRLRIDGFEWFIYNRTPIYDWLKEALGRQSDPKIAQDPGNADAPEDVISVFLNDIQNEAFEPNTPPYLQPKDNFFRKLLPLQIVSDRGAIIIGNSNLPTILVAEFKRVEGTYEACRPRSHFDYYKTSLSLNFSKPKISLKTNVDYRDPSLTEAERLRAKRKTRHGYISRLFGRSSEKDAEHLDIDLQSRPVWSGLSRYKMADIPSSKKRALFEEYAKVSNILECETLEMVYYSDVAGPVPQKPNPMISPKDIEVGNGDLSPQWGVDLKVKSGYVHYGPWADRQRVLLQNFFFPPTYRNWEKTPLCQPGQSRLHTAFKLLVQFDGENTIRIPTREPSKDWKYLEEVVVEEAGNASNSGKVKSTRAYGWIDFKFGHGSTLHYNAPIYQKEDGYESTLNFLMANSTVSTSLNYAELLQSSQINLDFRFPGPLKWNEGRTWTFNVGLDNSKIWLLRDHVLLFQDLMADFSSGPPYELQHFTPYVYDIRIAARNLVFYLCLNDGNIINQANDLNDNVFMVLQTSELRSDISIPFINYEAIKRNITFKLGMDKTVVSMSFPPSHTIGAFLSEDAREISTVEKFEFTGFYEYHFQFNPSFVDVLFLKMKGDIAKLRLFGFVIRYTLVLPDNYFGNFMSFITGDEYLSRAQDPASADRLRKKEEAAKPKENAFELQAYLDITEAMLELPQNLYSCQRFTQVKIQEIQIENRNFTHYQDIVVNFSPIIWTSSNPLTSTVIGNPQNSSKVEMLLIDGASIHGHRLMGPLPDKLVYAVDWRLEFGQITGDLSPLFAISATEFLSCFLHHYDDKDNLLNPIVVLPDITCANIEVAGVDVSLWSGSSVLKVKMNDGLKMHFDNVVNVRYCDRVVVHLPNLCVQGLTMTNKASDNWMFDDEEPWVEVLYIAGGFRVLSFSKQPNWSNMKKTQQSFVQSQDRETHRCTRLYEEESDIDTKEFEGTEYDDLFMHAPIYSTPFQVMSNASNISPKHDLPSRVPQISAAALKFNRASFKIDEESFTGGIEDFEDFDSTEGYHSRHSSIDDVEEVEFIGNHFDFTSISDDIPSRRETTMGKNDGSLPSCVPYRNYLRRFKAVSRGSVVSPFTDFEEIQQNEHILFFKSKDDGNNSFTDTSLRTPFHDIDDRDEDSQRFVVIDSASDLRVLLTPMISQVIQAITTSLQSKEWTVESLMDKLQVSYTDYLTTLFQNAFSSVVFDIMIPVTHIQCIQDLTLPDQSSLVGDDLNMSFLLADSLLCAFDIDIEDWCCRVCLRQRNTSMEYPKGASTFSDKDHATHFLRNSEIVDFAGTSEMKRFSLSLKFLGSMNNSIGMLGIPLAKQHHRLERTSPSRHQDVPVLLDVLSEGIKWETGFKDADTSDINSFFDAKTHFTKIGTMNQTLEVMFGALYTWRRMMKSLEKLGDDSSMNTKYHLGQLLASVVNASVVDKVEGDPSFLTQPSNTWNLGVRNFQRDTGWKVMMHTRYCLQHLSSSSLSVLTGLTLSSNKLTPNFQIESARLRQDVLAGLSHWRSWEIGDLSSCLLLQQLYASDTVNDFTGFFSKSIRGDCHLSLQSHEFLLSIHELEHDDNSLLVENFKVNLESNCTGLTENGDFSLPVRADSIKKGVDGTNVSIVGMESTLCCSIQKIGLTVSPNIFGFSMHVFRVMNWVRSHLVTDTRSKFQPTHKARVAVLTSYRDIAGAHSETHPNGRNYLDLFAFLKIQTFFVIDSISVKALADNLILRIKLTDVHSSTTHTLKRSSPRSLVSDIQHSAFVPIKNVQVRAVERVFKIGDSSDFSDLLTVDLSNILWSANVQHTQQKSQNLVLLCNIGDILVRLPRSFLKLHSFLEQWGDENLARYDFMFNQLMNEISMKSSSLGSEKSGLNVTMNATKLKFNPVSIQFLVNRFSVQSDLLASLRFFYNAYDFSTFIDKHICQEAEDSITSGLVHTFNYSAYLTRQEIVFLTKDTTFESVQSSAIKENLLLPPPRRRRTSIWTQQSATFTVPSISVKGRANIPSTASLISQMPKKTNLSPKMIDASVELDYIDVMLTVHMIDQLLTAQSVLGGELNDVIDAFMFYKQKKSKPSEANHGESNNMNGAIFGLDFAFNGFRIGVESPASVVVFECSAMSGLIKKFSDFGLDDFKATSVPLSWNFSAEKFLVSLSQSGVFEDGENSNSNQLAYILASFHVKREFVMPKGSAELDELGIKKNLLPLRFVVERLHAVMQPVALGKLIDVYVFFSNELETRKVLKARELDKLKENAQLFMKSIYLNDMTDSKTHSALNLEEQPVVDVEFCHVGVAVPLFIHGIQSVSPTFDMWEHPVHGLSPAFLSSGRSIRFKSQGTKIGQVSVNDLCIQFVEQFDLKNERHFSPAAHPTMNRFLLPLLTCYVNGKSSAHHAAELFVDGHSDGFESEMDTLIAHYFNALKDIYEKSKTRLQTVLRTKDTEKLSRRNNGQPTHSFSIHARFTFASSICRIHSKSKRAESGQVAQKQQQQQQKLTQDPDLPFDEMGIQVLKVPGFDAIVDGEFVVGDQFDAAEDFGLHFAVEIHQSENVLHSSILPFANEILRVVEGLSTKQTLSSNYVADRFDVFSFDRNRHQITFFVRILPSKFIFSCEPLNKVRCITSVDDISLFVTRYAIKDDDSKRNLVTTYSVKVSNVSSHIQHQFSPEACFAAHVKEISCSASVSSGYNRPMQILEIFIPKIESSMNIRHLQDYFVFTRVWLEKPGLDSVRNIHAPLGDSGEVFAAQLPPHFSSVNNHYRFVLKIGLFELNADLSQAIGKFVLLAEDVESLGEWNENIGKCLLASVNSISVKSDGKLSGATLISGVQLCANSSDPLAYRASSENESRTCTDIQGQVFSIVSQFQFQYERILLAEIQEVVFSLQDDWTILLDDRDIDVGFSFEMKNIECALSRKTVPTFIDMLEKLVMTIEEKRGVETIKLETKAASSAIPKPTSSSTIVRRFFSMDDLGITAHGRLQITLGKVVLNLMKLNFRDPEFVQIISKRIVIAFSEKSALSHFAKQMIDLDLEGATVKKSVSKPISQAEERSWSSKEWFQFLSSANGKNVIGIPSTMLLFNTTTYPNEKKVVYSFKTDFGGAVDVALNFGLYKFIQDLVALYGKALVKTVSKEDESTSSTKSSSPTSPRDGKAPKGTGAILEEDVQVDFTFEQGGEVRFEPQLKVIGDATPTEWIELLGLHKNNVPQFVYKNLTLQMEALLIMLGDVYKSMLPDKEMG